MSTEPAAYNSFARMAGQALVASEMEACIQRDIDRCLAEDAPSWIKSGEQLASILSSAQKAASVLAQSLLAYTEEMIRLYRANVERPNAPNGRTPRAGDTPSSN